MFPAPREDRYGRRRARAPMRRQEALGEWMDHLTPSRSPLQPAPRAAARQRRYKGHLHRHTHSRDRWVPWGLRRDTQKIEAREKKKPPTGGGVIYPNTRGGWGPGGTWGSSGPIYTFA